MSGVVCNSYISILPQAGDTGSAEPASAARCCPAERESAQGKREELGSPEVNRERTRGEEEASLRIGVIGRKGEQLGKQGRRRDIDGGTEKAME